MHQPDVTEAINFSKSTEVMSWTFSNLKDDVTEAKYILNFLRLCRGGHLFLKVLLRRQNVFQNFNLCHGSKIYFQILKLMSEAV